MNYLYRICLVTSIFFVSNVFADDTDYFEKGSGIRIEVLKYGFYSIFLGVLLLWLLWVGFSQFKAVMDSPNPSVKNNMVFLYFKAMFVFIIYFVFFTALVF